MTTKYLLIVYDYKNRMIGSKVFNHLDNLIYEAKRRRLFHSRDKFRAWAAEMEHTVYGDREYNRREIEINI